MKIPNWIWIKCGLTLVEDGWDISRKRNNHL